MEGSRPSLDAARDDRLAEVIEQYLADLDSGAAPSRNALLEQHPELAEDLAACLETLDFIGHSLGQGPATSVLECGQQFGEYQILRELGRGGMGVVYEAFHLGLERRVALKVLSGRSFEDEKHRERFLLEAKTAASLHHTNIVPIFEVGELDGVCYYAMQYIRGQSLGTILRRLTGREPGAVDNDITIFPPGTIVHDERAETGESSESKSLATRPTPGWDSALRDGPITERYFREVARLIAQAADALAHAHGHGIVHRDVKPSNLILDGENRLWVTDFGLAFRPRESQGARDAAGTPAYMSPEQVRPESGAVDHRTDIYSLGATLYESLTLRAIVEGDTSLALLTKIATIEPVAPRRHNPLIPKDLDCIVRHATNKCAEGRYQDMAAMASDLRKYLTFEPVAARRVGPIGRLQLWCRREPRLAGVTAAAATLLLLVSIVSHWAILHARNAAIDARNIAEDQLELTVLAEADARENYHQALFQQARAALLTIQNGRRWTTLDLIRQAQAIRNNFALRDAAIAAMSISDARLLKKITVDSVVERLSFCFDNSMIAFTCSDGSVRLWKLGAQQDDESDRVVLAASGHDFETLAVSPSGQFVAALETDGPITIFDVASGGIVNRLELDDFRPRFLAFLADQKYLIALNDSGLCRRWQLTESQAEPLEPIETVRWVTATKGPTPESITLATPGGEVEVCDVVAGTRQPLGGVLLNRNRPSGLTWSQDGKTLAVGLVAGSVDIWTLGVGHPRALGLHRGNVRAVAFNPAATLLASSGTRDSTVKLWDLKTGDLLASLRDPQSGANWASFSPDGQLLAVGGADKTLWLWEVKRPDCLTRLAAHEDIVAQVAVSPDGHYVASGSIDGNILLLNVHSTALPTELVPRSEEKELRLRPFACADLAFSPDSRRLAARLRNGAIRVWDLESRQLYKLDTDLSMWSGGAVAFLPDGRSVIRSSGRLIQSWEIGSDARPREVGTASEPVSAMAYSPVLNLVAVCTWRNRIEFFDVSTRSKRPEAIELEAPGLSMAFSPDGRRLAVGDRTGVTHMLELASRAPLWNRKESDDELSAVAFSPDGAWVGIAGQDGTVRLRLALDGSPVADFPGHEGGTRSLAFGPRSQKLITGGDDKLVHVWQLEELNRELETLGLAW